MAPGFEYQPRRFRVWGLFCARFIWFVLEIDKIDVYWPSEDVSAVVLNETIVET